MHFLTIIILLTSALMSYSLRAEESKIEVHNMQEMLSSIHLEKKQIEIMVDKMVLTGRLNADEAKIARRELASVKESDIEIIKQAAINQMEEKSAQAK